MGVPAFFRWLSRKHVSILVHCVEEKPKNVDGVKIPVDASQPNPNDVEFDNLYLDMNGIIHPCCHPEDKPAPKNEDEMMVLIFEYIDRIFAIVRPRRLLYMAIDGVAPRAKMNQQRSRRFRASKESEELHEEITRIKDEMSSKGLNVPPEKKQDEKFDSNCITPGTPFMFRLAECLRYYVHDRLNNDPGWQDIKVILSDANVPGEGEHKIMDYIRKQRGQPDHDPNTQHCLCGADADLIMLGLATHEPNFTIIREEFKPNQPKPCAVCGQMGHEMKECTGLAKEKKGEFDEIESNLTSEAEFIFIRLNILREYLEKDLEMKDLPFTFNFERAIDDWVLMCFFVGNDFLPHLPSLEIREGAIDRLVRLYKDAVRKTGGYLTQDGKINLSRVQLVLNDLGKVEDEIFKTRRENDLRFKKREADQKKRAKRFESAERPKFMPGGQFAPQPLMGGQAPVSNPRHTAAQMRIQAMNFSTDNKSNEQAAADLRASLSTDGEQKGTKRKSTHDDNDDEEAEPADEVKLWEDGWKDRYYQSKFGIDEDDMAFRHKVANEYVLGLCWVLKYYYQGCPSWKWYFPYHYAPFASDFLNIGDLDTDFEKDTEPFKPLEQLMGVFPAGSRKFVPPSWQELMTDEDSPIIDFYPSDFHIDLNGKKYAWQGVALLPFVDEKRLLSALAEVYPDITPAEKARNIRGNDRLFVSSKSPFYNFCEGLFENGGTTQPVEVTTKLTTGMGGLVWCDKHAIMTGETMPSPLSSLPALQDNRTMTVAYKDPQYECDHIFSAEILPGAKFPARVLKPEDLDKFSRGQPNRGGYRPQLGFKPQSGYRQKGSYDSAPALRHVGAALGSPYRQVAPPLMPTPKGGHGRRQGSSGGGRQDRSSGGRSYSGGGGGGGGGGSGGGASGYNQYGGQSGGQGQGNWGNQGGYYGTSGYGYGQGGGSGGSHGNANAWSRNVQGQQGAYQQNQQRGQQQGQQGNIESYSTSRPGARQGQGGWQQNKQSRWN